MKKEKAIDHRLRALKVRNRRLSILVGALLVGTAGGFATLAVGEARAEGRVVRAEQVVIEDASGVSAPGWAATFPTPFSTANAATAPTARPDC